MFESRLWTARSQGWKAAAHSRSRIVNTAEGNRFYRLYKRRLFIQHYLSTVPNYRHYLNKTHRHLFYAQNHVSQNQRLARFNQKTRLAPSDYRKNIKSNAKLHYASAKANAKATARTLQAVAHCVSRLAEAPSDESAAVVAIPGPESVGNTIRPEEVETPCSEPDCWRKIVLTCKTSPAAIG